MQPLTASNEYQLGVREGLVYVSRQAAKAAKKTSDFLCVSLGSLAPLRETYFKLTQLPNLECDGLRYLCRRPALSITNPTGRRAPDKQGISP